MRIAIVNDLATVREGLRQIILSVPGHEIAWVACDGEEAVNKNTADTPDLILMDLMMPVMDGVEATRRIMSESPCPILVVTATVGNNAARVFEAMGHGALDAVTIPMMGNGAEAERSRYVLLRKIHIIAKLGRGSSDAVRHVCPVVPESVPSLIVMGASTGGPKALAEVISRLPENFEAAVVIVQHVDEKFSAGFANWLDAQTPLQVKLAPEGGRPKSNTIYVAGTNDHLIITASLTFSYTSEAGDTPFRPSVNVFFKSVARHWPDYYIKTGCVAVLLTGMGRDGAEGLAALRGAGWHTIAQDEASSIVYGMPKAAKELDAAVEILPVKEIAPAILSRFQSLASRVRAADQEQEKNAEFGTRNGE
ncbi:chemotaxis response regulator protein-glutamate methylesterase [Desulfonema magnum]|uniref:Protein-glutamate methylesterase/protein-glutamine glutaminase n=1 Tax=Desulfonema magnum TaxID=45655 RepID=A0A975BKS4_9BACT|nr:chemotaxis response regulator protein-glutamate methylesterase [Desulfonema magnum]QTA87382.1 Protein-glutamate methylesterase/protein-glutamine glutaminase [Desulfonema magnum]